jgi:hypothetical protein
VTEKKNTDTLAGVKDRPVIVITTEEGEVTDQAVKALAGDKTVYQHGGKLVRIVHYESLVRDGTKRRRVTARVEPLPRASLRERLTVCAIWQDEKGRPAHPPGWCVSAVRSLGSWPGVRHLEADHPALKPDGTILDEPEDSDDEDDEGRTAQRIREAREVMKPSPVKLNRVPLWLKKRLIAAKKAGKFDTDDDRYTRDDIYYAAAQAVQTVYRFRDASDLLDHWGTTDWYDWKDAFVTEPYHHPAQVAKSFADLLGLEWNESPNSWWNPGETFRIVFYPWELAEALRDEEDRKEEEDEEDD